MKNRKTFINLIIIFLTTLSISMVGTGGALAAQQPVNSRAAIAIDANTGQVLYQKNVNKPLPVASMSKLVTSYIVLQKIKQHQLKWNDKVSVSPQIEKLGKKKGMTNVPLKANQKYTVDSLYQAGLIGSANDAEVALGNKLSGNPENFAKLMNKTVKQMGIKNANLVNACGLTNAEVSPAGTKGLSGKAENKLSAKDMAILAQKIITDYPSILNVTKKDSYNFKNAAKKHVTTVTTSNEMLPGQPSAVPGIKVDGLKTGKSPSALDNFTGTATKDGNRLITVVIGANDGQRFTSDKNLMENVYDDYQPQRIANINGKINVPNGRSHSAKIKLAKAITIWRPKAKKSVISQKIVIKPKLRDGNGLLAPISKNQEIGRNYFTIANDGCQFLVRDGNSVAIKASESVKASNIFVRIYQFFIDI